MPVTKVYNGSAYVETVLKVWDGSVWRDQVFLYDGSEYVEINEFLSEVVTLSGETTTANEFMSDAFAYIQIRTDGTVWEDGNGSWVQVDSLTDWLVPPDSAPGLFEVRWTAHTGDPLTSYSAAEDIWRDLSLGHFQCMIRTFGGPFATESATFTFQIRYDGGDVLASGSYTLNANREDF